MFLNLSLGFLLALFPHVVNNILFVATFPIIQTIIILTGVGLFLFGSWQITVVQKKMFEPNIIGFLGYAAVIPAIFLTFFLFFNHHLVSTLGSILLMSGTVYMYVLGVFYLKKASP